MRRAILLAVSLLAATALAQEQARPWIGIAIDAGPHGVLVKEVIEKTPAARAGLLAGDEVLSLDGRAVATPAQLIGGVQERGVGEKVKLRVLRGDHELSVEMALEAKPDELALLRSQLVGKPAPPFDLQSVNGLPARSADLAGKVTVVEFWATWCGPCNATLPRLDAWQKKYGARGLRVVGISAETMDVITRHARTRRVAYSLARDPDGATSNAYHVTAIPTILVIDRAGVVRYVDVGAGDRLDAAEAALVPLLR